MEISNVFSSFVFNKQLTAESTSSRHFLENWRWWSRSQAKGHDEERDGAGPNGLPGTLAAPTASLSSAPSYSSASNTVSGEDSDATKDAPNISLNVNPTKSSAELYLMVVVGIALQAAVLVFAGLATYYWEFLKDGERMRAYSYPTTATGTIFLALGMFICAAVVERSTEEANYAKVPGARRYNIRIVWLQRGRIVNDQTFDSFAVIATTPSDVVLTSRRSRTSAGRPTDLRRSMQKGFLFKIASSPAEAFTVAGVLISLVGFILQFSGLRGSNWTISIAQLVATMVMTLVRAIGRRSLVKRPSSVPLTAGYEQDWLATSIGTDRAKFWDHHTAASGGEDNATASPPSPRGSSGQAVDPSADAAGQLHPSPWRIQTGDNARAFWIKNPATDVAEYPNNNESQEIIRLRQRLGILSKWVGPVSPMAVSVANSIDEVMNVLFPTVSEPFVFALNVQSDRETHWIRLTVQKSSKEQPWTANAAEIEAILSLWVYHTHQAERNRALGGAAAAGHPPEGGPGGAQEKDDDDDWLRKGDKALPRQIMRFLGPDTPALRRDLNWWMPGRLSTLLRVEAIRPVMGRAHPGGVNRILGHSRIAGFSKLSDSKDPVDLSASHEVMEIESQSLNIDEIEASGSYPVLSLATMSDTTLEVSFAQHLFSAFMWAVSKKIARIEGQSSAKQTDMLSNPTAWHYFKLENTTISRIAQAVQKTGLGSLEDVYLCIVPPLSHSLRLPDAAAASLVLNAVASREPFSAVTEFASTYLELLRFGTKFGPSADGRLCPFAIKSVALVVEYCRTVSQMTQLLKYQCRDAKPLESIRDGLAAKLKDVDPNLMHVLRTMYENQDRLEGLDGLVPELPPNYNKSSRDIDTYVEYTPLNREILSRRFKEAEKHFKYANEKDILGWNALFYAVNIPNLDDEELVRYCRPPPPDMHAMAY